MTRNMQGTTAVELLVTIAIVAALSTMSTVALTSLVRRQALREMSIRIYTLLHVTQAEAVTGGNGRAVRFSETERGWAYSIYEDGDGDGVMNSDIKKGIDPAVRGPNPLCVHGSLACLGFGRDGATDPDTGAPVPPGASPLNFNQSALCSFAPDGDSTPGTIYLTDGIDTWALRSSGSTGRVYLMKYNRLTGHWQAHEQLPS